MIRLSVVVRWSSCIAMIMSCAQPVAAQDRTDTARIGGVTYLTLAEMLVRSADAAAAWQEARARMVRRTGKQSAISAMISAPDAGVVRCGVDSIVVWRDTVRFIRCSKYLSFPPRRFVTAITSAGHAYFLGPELPQDFGDLVADQERPIETAEDVRTLIDLYFAVTEMDWFEQGLRRESLVVESLTPRGDSGFVCVLREVWFDDDTRMWRQITVEVGHRRWEVTEKQFGILRDE